MVQECCVLMCDHTHQTCKLKRFPSDSRRATIWQNNLGIPGWERTPESRICECHFDETQFDRRRQDSVKKLKPDALPLVFPTHILVVHDKNSKEKWHCPKPVNISREDTELGDKNDVPSVDTSDCHSKENTPITSPWANSDMQACNKINSPKILKEIENRRSIGINGSYEMDVDDSFTDIHEEENLHDEVQEEDLLNGEDDVLSAEDDIFDEDDDILYEREEEDDCTCDENYDETRRDGDCECDETASEAYEDNDIFLESNTSKPPLKVIVNALEHKKDSPKKAIVQSDKKKSESVTEKVSSMELTTNNVQNSPEAEESSSDVLTDALNFLQFMLPHRWIAFTEDTGIYTVLLSKSKGKAIQRSIFAPLNGGEFELYVHGKKLPKDHEIAQSFDLVMPLTRDSLGDYVDRIINVIETMASYEICAGVNHDLLMKEWFNYPNCFLDYNPFKEESFKKTVRSINCLFLAAQGSERCRTCDFLLMNYSRKRAISSH